MTALWHEESITQFISKLWFILLMLSEMKGEENQIFHMDAVDVLANSCQHEETVTNHYLTQASLHNQTLDFSQRELHQHVKDLGVLLGVSPLPYCQPLGKPCVGSLPSTSQIFKSVHSTKNALLMILLAIVIDKSMKQ